jgi:hypothetical protein
LLELVAVEPLAVAGRAAEFLPAGAGVVVVVAAVPPRAHSDVGALALAAAHDAGEQEVGGVAAPAGHVLTPLGEQSLRAFEGLLLDERLVQAGVALAAPVHPAQVGLVGEQPLDDGGLPAARRRRRLLRCELACDRDRAHALARVELEDALHDRRLRLVGDDVFLCVAPVAEGEPAGRPVPLLSAPLDPGGDAVDDRRVLKLREHTEHLEHHPPRGGARVERLGRGAQRTPVAVQLLGELGELAHIPGQAVDAVDEQQVDPALAGERERALQPGTGERRAGHSVLLLGDDPPALLGAAESLQPLALREERGGLVFLVGRDPRVQTDAQLVLLFDVVDQSRTSGRNQRSVSRCLEQELGQQLDSRACFASLEHPQLWGDNADHQHRNVISTPPWVQQSSHEHAASSATQALDLAV